MGLSVNFGDFVNKTGFSLSASDYLVGFTTDYDGNRQEIRITVEDFITYIESNSANDLYTILNQNSGKWDSVYLSVSPNSGYWDSVYNTVNTVSSSWTTGGTSLTTVLNYLSTNVTRLSGLSFSDSVKIYPIITKNYTIALIGAISGVNFSVSFNAASASGDRSFAANSGKATGEYSFAEGLDTSSSGSGSHSEGYQTIASGTASHSEGVETAATGSGSHSEGYKTNAIGGIGGIGNHAEGGYTATGEYVPYVSYDSNLYAFTFSNDLSAKFSNVIPGNILRGYYSDFKGTTLFTFTLKDRDTINGVLSATTNIDISPSSGFIVLPDDKPYKHAEGMFSQAVGRASHAEGINTVAFGDYSHSAGFYSKAAHNRTWIWKGSTTTNLVCTTRTDQFMVSAEGGVFIPSNVGINTDDNTNALTVQGTISAKNLVVTGNLSALGVAYYTSVSFVTASSASYTDIVVTNLTATRIVNSKLDTVYSTTNTNSSYWSLAYNNLIGNSASYLSAYNISLINANSAKWDVAYTNLLYNSANYLTGTAVNLGNIPSLSSYWTEAYTNLVGNSSNYLTGTVVNFGNIPTLSSNWDNTYTAVSNNSANWNSTYTTLNTNSTNGISVYTSVSNNSANWNNTYTQYSQNSGTYASNTLFSNYLPTSGGTVNGDLSVIGTTYIEEIKEKVTLSASNANSTINFDLKTQSVLFLTLSSTGNWIVNFRGDNTTSLNSIMSAGQSFTCVSIVSTGTTVYYNSAVQIDGTTYTPYYLNGLIPQSVISNARALQNYAYTIIKRGNAVFNVLASVNEYY